MQHDVALVPLTKGHWTTIDRSDLLVVSLYSWQAKIDRRGMVYAFSDIPDPTKPRGRRTLGLHRFLLGDPPGLEVDHINGDPLDNRRQNLRSVTKAQNLANQRRSVETKSAPFKGVSFRPDKKRNPWHSRIRIDSNLMHLGYYPTPEDAARAYDRAALEHFGEFAYLNFEQEHST